MAQRRPFSATSDDIVDLFCSWALNSSVIEAAGTRPTLTVGIGFGRSLLPIIGNLDPVVKVFWDLFKMRSRLGLWREDVDAKKRKRLHPIGPDVN